jgi:hypothetical protein
MTGAVLSMGRLGLVGAGPQPREEAEARGGEAAAGLPFDDVRFESRLVWILGSPRTGSTWLLRLLIHPWRLDRVNLYRANIGFRSGGSIRREKGPAVVPIDESFFPRHLTPFIPITHADESPREAQDFVFNTERAGHLHYCFSDAYAEVWRPELRRLILVRFHAQAERARTKLGIEDPLVVIKEPNGSYGAELLMSLLPRARMIFLSRDGRDVLDSQLALRTTFRTRGRRMRRIREDKQRLTFVRTQARLWVNNMTAVQNAYAAHPPDQRITVRYEDLRSDTFVALRPLVDWLGTDRTDEQLHKAIEELAFEAVPRIAKGPGKGKRAATPGLWRENLSSEEQQVATELMGDKLTELGYEL